MAKVTYAELVAVADRRTDGAFSKKLLDPNGADGSMLFVSGAMAILEILVERDIVTDPEDLLDGQDCIDNHNRLNDAISDFEPPSLEELLQEMMWQNPTTRRVRESLGTRFDSTFCISVTFVCGWLLRKGIIPASSIPKLVKFVGNLAKTHPAIAGEDDVVSKINDLVNGKKPPQE